MIIEFKQALSDELLYVSMRHITHFHECEVDGKECCHLYLVGNSDFIIEATPELLVSKINLV